MEEKKQFDTLEELFLLDDGKENKQEYNEMIIPICQVKKKFKKKKIN